METNGLVHLRNALVLYGTETGTSQDLAEELGRTLERFHFSTSCSGLDSSSPTELADYTITVFVVATTGQGDFPSNARKFWTSLLRKKLGPSFLKGVHFALVGLGDSSYPKFNWSARKLEKRLRQLGATELLEACEADEQGDESTDGAFLAWSEHFRSMLASQFPLPHGLSRIPDDVRLPSRWKVTEYLDNELQNGHANGPLAIDESDAVDLDSRLIFGSISASLQLNARVTPSHHWQDVRLLKLHVSEHVEYFPGDALAILPKNNKADVRALIDLMEWQEVADLSLHFKPSNDSLLRRKHVVPPISDLHDTQGFTLRGLLRDYLDIKAIPRRSFFAAVAPYTNDEMHRERLLEFTNPEYLDEYYDYATRPRRSILEILQEFDSVRVPFQEAANVFPVMRPRQFSIASGGVLKHRDGGTTFELLVAIVKYQSVIRRIREGVCTKYLAGLEPGSTLNVVLKTEGRFDTRSAQMPLNHILIGPGTGIAPLRALIYEKTSIDRYSPEDTSTMLFFGARSSAADYFFQDEWEKLMEKTKLEVVTAFSRDQKIKVYVQDRIRENGEALRQLLTQRNATVIVCGSSGQMPKSVRAALADVLARKETSASDTTGVKDDAETFLTQLEKKGRYKQETW